ncbi:hypothetical protein LOTGIDRAFT_145160 [Lottia gigantea]|uniref:Uncharacterized protein n=1 Tax=Lottia gigantea TaxID=225164 RepID=V4ABC1_LOTGI|nr:hypothetical protein LOTGIDRAFT_145160 [Lottia gigantea]ESO94107.1 hypothetical protein LOTGIDRAFT_145160 [Lottia gigantea]
MAEFTKKVPEDVVEYTIYPPLPGDLEKEHLKILLDDLLEVYLTQLSPEIINYLWQKDPFELHAVLGKGDEPGCLQGQTNYGDNIDDEWFIVYLLFQLTKACPGLVASIHDNDGEFILIEAAEVLPKWLDPDTAENRIFIYNGELHIIPIPENANEMSDLPLFTPSVPDAVNIVREHEHLTKAKPEIQNAIMKKLQTFPEKASQNLHYANCYIPTSVASVLEQNPSLVAPAVEAFYYRDPVDLKACRSMKNFPQEDMVIYRVKFTRFMYAQLLQQDFQPDRRSGWTLPSKTNSQFKQDDIGLKLAHGFEILCARCGGKKSSINGHTQFNEQDGRWQRYLQALKDNGFFKNELEGSKHYKILLEDAKSFYTDNLANQKRKKKEPGNSIFDLLDSSTYSMEDFKKKEKVLPPSDDDSWIEVSPDDLDQLLHTTVGTTQSNTTQQDTFDLSQISQSMKSFVDNVSSVDGVEFPKEDDGDGEIQFDGMGFIHAMQKMFDFPEDKDDDSDDDIDEYDWQDDDDDIDDLRPSKSFQLDKPKIKTDQKIKQYMEQMDRELDKTEMGKSFDKVPKSKPASTSANKPKKSCNIEDEDDDFRPVDIDLTLVKNTLQSFSAQQGLAGPASHILNNMGIHIPQNAD